MAVVTGDTAVETATALASRADTARSSLGSIKFVRLLECHKAQKVRLDVAFSQRQDPDQRDPESATFALWRGIEGTH